MAELIDEAVSMGIFVFTTLPPVDILLVDDDEIFLAITEDVVEEMGTKAETTSCCEKVLELVKTRQVIFVLQCKNFLFINTFCTAIQKIAPLMKPRRSGAF